MPDISIKLRFAEIDGVSDRTARKILRDLSQLCRRVHLREAEAIMRSANLNRRERQSLHDKINSALPDEPAFYLKRMEEGSIEVAVVLTGAGMWLLQATLGETLKASWKEARVHNAIVDWVKRRQAKVPDLIAQEADKHDFLDGRAIGNSSIEKPGYVEITLQPSEYEVVEYARIDEELVLRRSMEALDNDRRR